MHSVILTFTHTLTGPDYNPESGYDTVRAG
jgi:hypothetical protein